MINEILGQTFVGCRKGKTESERGGDGQTQTDRLYHYCNFPTRTSSAFSWTVASQEWHLVFGFLAS